MRIHQQVIVTHLVVIAFLSALGGACKSSTKKKAAQAAQAGSGGPLPDWVKGTTESSDKVCAMGIAGRTHKMAAEKGKELSRERAVRNLAGIFETSVLEAGFDEQSMEGDSYEIARAVEVSEEMVERVSAAAEADYWTDEGGAGPFEEKGFTYAQACVGASFVSTTKAPPKELMRQASAAHLTSTKPPPWLTWVGQQKGARLCAVGYSLPALHPDATFEGVVEDIRGQLTMHATTLVMSMYDEFSVCRAGAAECEQIAGVLTAATTEAISKGVLVNHFWYDRQGIGPNKRPRSTYGWGCMHPVDSLRAALTKVKEEAPQVDVPSAERVKMRANDFFDELEKEEAKRQ